MAALHESIDTPAKRAIPGIDPRTSPFLSAMSSIVTKTMRVESDSDHTLEVSIDWKSLT